MSDHDNTRAPSPTTNSNATERRQNAPEPVTQQPNPLGQSVTALRISDIFSARNHSRDFREARAEYIIKRLRFMLMFFIVAVPAWIPIDYLSLSETVFEQIASARVVLAVVLLVLFITSLARPRHLSSSVLLLLAFAAPCAFYVYSMSLLHAQGVPPMAGYSAMPYMMATLLGLYPITLLYGCITLSLIVGSFIGLEWWLGTLTSHDALSSLWVLCMLCGIVIWIQTGQLLMLLKLYRESSCDPLTGLMNRRILIKALNLEAEKHRNDGTPFTILMFDLDRFKRINDNFGHLVGDQVLKKTADVLQDSLRRSDIVARYGGEEFIAVLPGINLHTGLITAERIRQSIAATQVYSPEGQRIPLTSSIGAVEFLADETVEQACQRADELLYLAKERGRNCVVSTMNDTRRQAIGA